MAIIRDTLERAGVLACVLAAAIGFAAPSVASAQPKVEATEWLASQLKSTSEGSYCELFSEASVGETIECSLAFKAAGSSFKADREATYKWVLANKSKYVGSKSCETTTEALSAGAVAKLAVAVEADGGNPESVGGRNLIADLKCLQVKTGTEAGRFSDKNQTNYSNVFGQSLAIIALKACEEGSCTSEPNLKTPIEKGAAYLRGQQCTEPKALAGAFRSSMGLSPTECNSKPPFEKETENENAVEVDSTGIAAQALLAAKGAESKSAAEKAVTWLKESSHTSAGPPPVRWWDGYCSESEPTKLLPSVNSTALASMAYVEDGLSIAEPHAWLVAAVDSGTNRGLPACGATGNGDVLATAQGIFGLYETTYPHLVGLP